MKNLIVAALFVVLLTVVNGEERHKMCCSACKSTYPHAHHLKHSCLHGCRLYAMIYLAHDKSLANKELSGMCDKSCQGGFSAMPGGADGRKACQTGCRQQERIFREHGLDEHGAKMSVVHGLGLPPVMQSVAPFHHRMFAQMRALHQRMMKAMAGAKHVVIQRVQIRIHSLPPGPDGKPRYQVEIHQHRVPFVFGRPVLPGFGPKPHHHGPAPPAGGDEKPLDRPLIGGDDHDKKAHGWHHHGDHLHGDHFHHSPMYRVRHFFTDMSEPAKVALRWSLFALLLASVLCLAWLCCRACRRVRASAAARQHLSITNALVKKKPRVQSGDIFYVDVTDKKPLMEEDALDDAAKSDKELLEQEKA